MNLNLNLIIIVISSVINTNKKLLINLQIYSLTILISAYELWFKQILFEMDIVRKLLTVNLWV